MRVGIIGPTELVQVLLLGGMVCADLSEIGRLTSDMDAACEPVE